MVRLFDVYKARLIVEVSCASEKEVKELAGKFHAKSVDISHQNIYFVSFSNAENMNAFIASLA